jgi:hypothetical protein
MIISFVLIASKGCTRPRVLSIVESNENCYTQNNVCVNLVENLIQVKRKETKKSGKKKVSLNIHN